MKCMAVEGLMFRKQSKIVKMGASIAKTERAGNNNSWFKNAALCMQWTTDGAVLKLRHLYAKIMSRYT